MDEENELQTDPEDLTAYYDSANDLFKQIALESGKEPPIDAKFYETLLLRKKRKNP